MAISLFNPGATPAVANLQFTVGSVTTVPSAFSSVPIEPGQDVVLFAGHALPQRVQMSLGVMTVSGRIAVGVLHFKVTSGALARSLTLGTQVPLGTWWFAPMIVGPGVELVYSILNTTAHQERVRLTVIDAKVKEEITIVIAADAEMQYVMPRLRVPGFASSSVAVVGRGAVIVDREMIVNRQQTLSAKINQIQLPATLPSGFAVTSPNVAPAKIWMIGGGRSDGVASEVIAIANPQRTATTVRLDEIVRARSIAIPGVRPVKIEPNAIASVDLSHYLKNVTALEIVVVATKPVVAGMSEYAFSAHGLNVPSALPVR